VPIVAVEPDGPFFGATVANAAWWDALDPAVQEFLPREISALSQEIWAQNRGKDREGIA
jgi:TRAP-type C4-dicarboxylate transport system substrate-binding protein